MAGPRSSSPTFGGWTQRASQFYFLIILFSFPIFSVPCRKGMCSSPIEVIATSLLAIGAPDAIVKVLLYPGLTFSRVESVVADTEPFAFPDWNNILKDANMSDKGHLQNSVAEFGLEAGCYLSVVGTVFTVLGVPWVSACGMVIVLWYIYTLGGKASDVFALPMFTLAMVCAMAGCVNLDRFLKKGEITEPTSINKEATSKESTVEESSGEELTRKQSTRKTSSTNAKKRR